MPIREYRTSLENLRIALERGVADVERLVPGWRQSARVVSLAADHASRAASRAGFADASDVLARISAQAREAGGLPGTEAAQRMRAIAEDFGRVERPAVSE
jgi:hypothetical protein